jgi:hypothetical protein
MMRRKRKVDMNSIHSEAIKLGYPLIRGNPIDIAYHARKILGTTDEPYALLANRFAKTDEPDDGRCLYLAWYVGKADKRGRWISVESNDDGDIPW